MPSKTKSSLKTDLPEWAYAKKPRASGCIKRKPEDFVVTEKLGFELSGSGEHVWLYIEKTGLNTQDLLAAIARELKLPLKDVAYSGLKDKQAVTRQWISVFTKQDMAAKPIDIPNVRVLQATRHQAKLKRGSHQCNTFEIVVRDIEQRADVESALKCVQADGVPNYFGAQRFGRCGNNIVKAQSMFRGELKPSRHQRGLYLSAARAYLFNQILSERVKQGCWNSGITGDAMMLAGSNSFFKTAETDQEIIARLNKFDIHPSAALWGRGALASAFEAHALETSITDAHPDLTQGLEAFGLRQQRRACRLIPQGLKHEWLDEQTLSLSFCLRRGAFATTILRELLTIKP